MNKALSVLSLFTALNVFGASLVEFSGSPEVLSASGIEVKVHPEAKVLLADTEAQTVKLSGVGIRQKKILFATVNVYAVQSYVMDPKVFKSTTVLEGVKSSPVRVLKLTMLRALSGEDIRSSFEEALDFNGVDLNQTSFKNVFAQFNFNAKAGDVFTIVTYPKSSLEKLVIELPNKTINEDGKDLGLDFWKVWFGKPIDSLMGDLQKSLVSKN